MDCHENTQRIGSIFKIKSSKFNDKPRSQQEDPEESLLFSWTFSSAVLQQV